MIELPYPNFTEILIFERHEILVISEMVHRSVFYTDNVLMFAFNAFLFHVFLGHCLFKEMLGFDC